MFSDTEIKEEFNNGWLDFYELVKDDLNKSLKLAFEQSGENLNNILPSKEKIFNIFKTLRPEEIKVVIIGQDPYPTPGNPNGYCFAYNGPNTSLPKSLINIKKATVNSGYESEKNDYTLTDWVSQGVFLLNSALTVKKYAAGSHSLYWKEFTKKLINFISDKNPNICYILWGKKAQYYSKYINESEKNNIFTFKHPSPLAGSGFEKCTNFIEVNSFLSDIGEKIIDWKI